MEYVRTDTQLGSMIDNLLEVPLIAADTEAAGFHRYYDRLCLLQISTRSGDFVVDTLAMEGLGTLGRLFADPDVEIIFHDADYDLRLLDRDLGIHVGGLFDTKIAAQFLGEPAFGLASLVEKYVGVKMEKGYQRADWAQRPLPREMLEYAAEDTRHLPVLRDHLRDALETKNRFGWAAEEFRLIEQVRWTGTAGDPDAYLRVKNARDLRPRQLAALRELFQWRETVARVKDTAPFRVLSNEALVEIARRMPDSPAGLGDVPGSPRSLVDRHGTEVLSALERAREVPADELPTRPRGPARAAPDAEFEALVERLRNVRDRVAESLGLDRGFLMPRAQLEELARLQPQSLDELSTMPGLRQWQIEAAGTGLLEILRG